MSDTANGNIRLSKFLQHIVDPRRRRKKNKKGWHGKARLWLEERMWQWERRGLRLKTMKKYEKHTWSDGSNIGTSSKFLCFGLFVCISPSLEDRQMNMEEGHDCLFVCLFFSVWISNAFHSEFVTGLDNKIGGLTSDFDQSLSIIQRLMLMRTWKLEGAPRKRILCY